jgi:hypothetical protein
MKKLIDRLFCYSFPFHFHKWVRQPQYCHSWHNTGEQVIPKSIGKTYTCEKCGKTRTEWKYAN